ERAALHVGGVVERDAVEQDQREVGVAAAGEHLRGAAERSGGDQVNAGDGAHQLGRVVDLRALDALRVEHGGRGGGGLGRTRGNDDLLAHVGVGGGSVIGVGFGLGA